VKLATKAREGSLKGERIRRIRGGKESLGYQLRLSYLNAFGFIHCGVMPQSGSLSLASDYLLSNLSVAVDPANQTTR
jgi:hypothetical protein